jgi:hypothetical protein
MKQLALLTITLSAVVSSTLTYAQSAPLTRAQVRADLLRIEQAGYNLSAHDDTKYPADIQAAEERVAAENAARGDQQRAAESLGGTQQRGSSDAGGPSVEIPALSIYFGQ